jgi:hypothetical protein
MRVLICEIEVIDFDCVFCFPVSKIKIDKVMEELLFWYILLNVLILIAYEDYVLRRNQSYKTLHFRIRSFTIDFCAPYYDWVLFIINKNDFGCLYVPHLNCLWLKNLKGQSVINTKFKGLLNSFSLKYIVRNFD